MSKLSAQNNKLTSGRNRFIDVLKGILILFVVITHYAWSDAERLKLLFPFWIDMAVPVFMIVSGYLNSISYDTHGIVSLDQAYSLKGILSKIIRFTVPFSIVFIFEEIMFSISGAMEFGIKSTLFRFLTGGFGPGSYYYPLMIQFIFLFPIIYFIIKKHDFKGLILYGIANGLYELLQSAYGMNSECYRLLVFRYILLIASGCYLHIGKKEIPKWIYPAGTVVGFGFITAVCYLGYTPFVLTQWSRTSFLACLYIIPICLLLIKKLRFGFLPLEIVGKASYNIFLVQMVYYNHARLIYNIIENKFLELLAGIAICVTAGLIFYLLETPLTKFISKKILNRIRQ